MFYKSTPNMNCDVQIAPVCTGWTPCAYPYKTPSNKW